MDYNKWFTRMIHTSNYRKTLRKEQKMYQGVVDMTEKQQYVINLLIKDVDMSTRDIISDYEEYMEDRDTISMRHVQRIRKWFKENKDLYESEDKKMSNQSDSYFDVADGLHEWELNVINLANEGGWSVQQIAERLNIDLEGIKKTIKHNQHFISESILDEDSPDVYFLVKDPVEVEDKALVEVQAELEEQEEPQEQANLDGNDEFWEVEIDCVSACSKAPKEVSVFMNKNSRDKAMMFMKWAGAREWLAYLVGTKDETGDVFHVNDLYLPEQRASQTLVDKVVAEQYNKMQVIGVIHSHHEMGAGDEDNPSFSGHDANFINGNHDLSLLAGKDRQSKGFKIVGIGRVKTPCGSLMQVKANIKAEKEKPSDAVVKLMNEFKEKVFGKKDDGGGYRNNESNGTYHFVNKDEMNL